MYLRAGDSEKNLAGRIVWIIGRRDSGKTTLIDALQRRVPGLIAMDDFLRCRAGIAGKNIHAYNQMIGLSYALAFQGFDCLVPCGARSRELRDHIRAELPSALFVYIAGRGRECRDYEDPQPDENILILDAALTTEQEVQILLEKIWISEPPNESAKKLCIEGQRPTTMRFGLYRLHEIIERESAVLDLGSNVGFMSLKCAALAGEVHGIERYAHWVEIADLAKEYLGFDNCHFHVGDALAFEPPCLFDVILSLSFHHWGPDVFARYVEVVLKGMLKPGGHLLFESHGPKSRELFERYADYLQSVGFTVRWHGTCQCPTTYPRPNPHRKFYMFQLKEESKE
jgi:SAM-dependent methyltransferase